MISSWDFDGVLYLGPNNRGPMPRPDDVIITGRSYEEKEETLRWLDDNGIYNRIFFNPMPFDKKTRESSGQHKAVTINCLLGGGFDITTHFEDDPVQAQIIKDKTPVTVVCLVHSLVDLENMKHPYP